MYPLEGLNPQKNNNKCFLLINKASTVLHEHILQTKTMEETGNPAEGSRLLFYLLEVKKILLFKYGGKEAVKLVKEVIIVSKSESRCDLCEKIKLSCCCW